MSIFRSERVSRRLCTYRLPYESWRGIYEAAICSIAHLLERVSEIFGDEEK
ncbi:hypothetical protein [Lysinibacillus sp. 3P01SB]|uniref:hypothetical protein n=1 Tax=Lysinibacillus sp. 3P01SB TaxID=3132284 RepID=UPI0039A4A78C